MSRRREAERPGEKKARPEKELPLGRFARRGPHLVDGRCMSPKGVVMVDQVLSVPEAKAYHRVQHPFLLGLKLLDGTLGAEEAAALAYRYLRKAEAEFDDLMKRANEQTAFGEPPINEVALGTEGRLTMELAKPLLVRLPPEACVVAALALRAGIDIGRLHEAELQATEIVAGDKVRRGAEQGGLEARGKGRKGRKSGVRSLPTEERIRVWREELAELRLENGSLPHGAISHVARRLAKQQARQQECASEESLRHLTEAERIFFNRYRDKILGPEPSRALSEKL